MPFTVSRRLFLLAVVALCAVAPQARGDEALVFISSFAPGDQGAITAFTLDVKTGELKEVHRTTDVENPFFLAVSPDERFLYSIHARQFGGTEHEQVAAYGIVGRSGKMKLLNRQSTRGTAACYLDVDAAGKTVVVANYTTGSVAALPIHEDGSLGEAASFFQHVGSSINPERQQEPHAHSMVIGPDNRFALAADLGTDQILCYRLDAATATLSPGDPPFARLPAGAGPRHLTFHPNGGHVYVINELLNSVTVFDYATETGVLTEKQTISTLPADFTGVSYTADVKVTSDGRYLYGTNRGHDSIAAFSIGEEGRLTLLEIVPSGGQGPQNLLITPGGELLLCANMPGNSVATFRIEAESGRLTSVGTAVELLSPSCIMLLP